MKKYVESGSDLADLLSTIEMVGTRREEWAFDWRIREVGEGPVEGWHIQCSFERPDANGGVTGIGSGRKWFIETATPVTGVVFTAWLAIQQIVMHELHELHELHESFTVEVDGERVRLLDPHKELTDLAVGSRRV